MNDIEYERIARVCYAAMREFRSTIGEEGPGLWYHNDDRTREYYIATVRYIHQNPDITDAELYEQKHLTVDISDTSSRVPPMNPIPFRMLTPDWQKKILLFRSIALALLPQAEKVRKGYSRWFQEESEPDQTGRL